VRENTTIYCLLVDKNLKENNHLKDIRTDGQIILKLILKRRDGRAWFMTGKNDEFL
jgi:hypothetical protein